jgi:hypothetical protein
MATTGTGTPSAKGPKKNKLGPAWQAVAVPPQEDRT